jgi:hypothetical protein
MRKPIRLGKGGLEGGRCNWGVSRFVGTREGIR